MSKAKALLLVLILASSFLLAAFPVWAADKSAVVPDGVVRLSRVDYDRLRDAADAARLAPERRKQPEPLPVIESATYEVKADAAPLALGLMAEVNVRPPATDAKLTLALDGPVDTLTDFGPAPVAAASEPGQRRVNLRFPKPGRYKLRLRLAPAEQLSGDRRTIGFTAVPASSVRISAESSIPGAELFLSPAAGSGEEPLPAGTQRALSSSAYVRVSVKSPARLVTAAEKPVVLAETVDVVRPERERLFVRSVVRLSVSRSALSGVTLLLPDAEEVISVSAAEEPRVAFDKEKRTAVVTPPRAVTGDWTFSVLFTRKAPAEGEPISLAPSRLQEATSVRAFLLVPPTPLREQLLVSNEGLARTDVADLPAFAAPFATSGARAFRAVDVAKALLVLRTPLRPVVAPPETLVREATILTVFGDGKSRTDRRQYLLETRRSVFSSPLEEGEEVLSVQVDGSPVKLQSDGGLLVVLLPASTTQVRSVDVTTKRTEEGPPKRGDFKVTHPPLPAGVLLARWTVVLPEGHEYRFVSSAGLSRLGWSRDATTVRRDVAPSAANWIGASSSEDRPRVAELRKKAKAERSPVPVISREAKPVEMKADAVVASGVEGGIEGGVMGGVLGVALGGVPGDTAATGFASSPVSEATNLQTNVAGIRSLPMEVTGHGKRLLLGGPVAGGVPLSVTLKVRPE